MQKERYWRIIITLLFSVIVLSACMQNVPIENNAIVNTEGSQFSDFTPGPTLVPTLTVSPFSLGSLAAREYGSGEFEVECTWHEREEFIRYKIVYSSDDLTIHGFVNIPRGEGPFPVVIALHGYIPASEYDTLDYSTRYADSIARKGYIVLHPNLRNFPPSDIVGRVRDYQSGYVIDVLNLLAHVRKLAGKEGIFENADLSHMGVWGHSLGGGTALRLVGIVPEIKAAVLYGAVSQRYSNDSAGFEIFDYQNTQAAFSVHHGILDDVISFGWSQRLCLQLQEAGKDPECFSYDDQPHTFYSQGQGDALFIQRTIEFFDRNLQ